MIRRQKSRKGKRALVLSKPEEQKQKQKRRFDVEKNKVNMRNSKVPLKQQGMKQTTDVGIHLPVDSSTVAFCTSVSSPRILLRAH
jgi:hypothetical protein